LKKLPLLIVVVLHLRTGHRHCQPSFEFERTLGPQRRNVDIPGHTWWAANKPWPRSHASTCGEFGARNMRI